MKLLWDRLLLKTVISLPKLPKHDRLFQVNHSVEDPLRTRYGAQESRDLGSRSRAPGAGIMHQHCCSTVRFGKHVADQMRWFFVYRDSLLRCAATLMLVKRQDSSWIRSEWHELWQARKIIWQTTSTSAFEECWSILPIHQIDSKTDSKTGDFERLRV